VLFELKDKKASLQSNKEFSREKLARNLVQFTSREEVGTDLQAEKIGDQITAKTLLLLLQLYILERKNCRLGYFVDKVAKFEPSKKKLLKVILDNLGENEYLRESTLISLAFSTFAKQSIEHLTRLPEIDDVVSKIKECTLVPSERQEKPGKIPTSDVVDFDVDLFFACCEMI
jgi:hypothetical protein